LSTTKTTVKTGILLINLGTPDAPTATKVRRYLAEFLHDRRVVDTPRWLWWPILHGIILRIRPRPAARAYRKIWTPQGSPLLQITRQLGHELRSVLQTNSDSAPQVAIAMCYGQPSIASALQELAQKDIDRLLVLPLYPQYSATTTAAAFDLVFKELMRWRVVPALHTIDQYHAHPAYIDAVSDSVRSHWQQQPRAQKLLFSFHGLPQSYVDAGDPYAAQCQRSSQLIADRLGLAPQDWQLCYQSRFGRKPWLQPYTDKTLIEWARQGTESVDVICPGFAVDCLETLEEINMQNRALFLENGGKSFNYIPALNSATPHARALAAILGDSLAI